MIFVTHDQEEAMRISDRIFVMEAGRVAQVSTSKEIVSESSEPICLRNLSATIIVSNGMS